MADIPYGKIVRRTWRKGNFRGLPDKQKLALAYLWTGPEAETCPAIYLLSLGCMAEDLNWSLEETTAVLDELEATGWLKYDKEARVVFLPKQVKFDEPRAVNNLKGIVRKALDLPETPLLTELWTSLEPYAKAFNYPLPNTLTNPVSNPLPNGVGNSGTRTITRTVTVAQEPPPTPSGGSAAAAGSLPAASKQEEFERYFMADENEAPLLAIAAQFGISREDFEIQLTSISEWMGDPGNAAKVARIRSSRFKQIIWDWLVREYGPPKGA